MLILFSGAGEQEAITISRGAAVAAAPAAMRLFFINSLRSVIRF
jgi:hypothetical protein